jgi:hypothetical protein
MVFVEYYLGTAAAITGAIIMIAALASPSKSRAPAALGPPSRLRAVVVRAGRWRAHRARHSAGGFHVRTDP